MNESDRERWRRYLEAPDPLAAIPARYLSARGFAERLQRYIEGQRRAGATAAVILEEVQARCEELLRET